MFYIRLKCLLCLLLFTCSSLAVVSERSELLIKNIRDGILVVDQLILKELIPGDHRFFMRLAKDRLGYSIDIPIRVIKGSDSGRVLMLLAGVHGDEAESILLVHRYLDWLKSNQVDGTVVAVNGLNIPGLMLVNRFYPGDDGQIPSVSLDKIFPGGENHVYPAGRILFHFWEKLVLPNVDYLVEIRGPSAHSLNSYHVYADYRSTRNQEFARLLQPEFIKVDKGSNGTAETAFVQSGRPAVTLVMGERGRADKFERALHGLKNLSYFLELVAGYADHSKQYQTIEVNEIVNLRATEGGLVELLVQPNADVSENHLVAIQFDVFGDVIAKYLAPFTGKILSVTGRSFLAPGEPVVRVVRKNQNSSCKFGC